MDKNLMDQFIQINTGSSHSNRNKANTAKYKQITQPISTHMGRDPIFTSNMAMHGSVPSHIQERQMKEAVMTDARSNQKHSG